MGERLSFTVHRIKIYNYISNINDTFDSKFILKIWMTTKIIFQSLQIMNLFKEYFMAFVSDKIIQINISKYNLVEIRKVGKYFFLV